MKRRHEASRMFDENVGFKVFAGNASQNWLIHGGGRSAWGLRAGVPGAVADLRHP